MNLHTETSRINDTRKTNEAISINLKPTKKELGKLEDLQTAIDILICQNCFTNNNPMRKVGSDILFWDWVIVTVNGYSIPTPIHSATKKECALYKRNGEEVLLTYKQCAITTAFFYYDNLARIGNDWTTYESYLHPLLATALSKGVLEIKNLPFKKSYEIWRNLRSSLCAKGYNVIQ